MIRPAPATAWTRPFVDTPVTDLDGARRAAAEVAEAYGHGEVLLVRRGMNAVFSCGDRILRVGHPSADATAALELADLLRDTGVRVALPADRRPVIVGDFTVTVWERVVPVADAIDWSDVGRQIRRLHRLDAGVLPASMPCPSPTVLPWWEFETALEEVRDLLDPAAMAGLVQAIDRGRAWRISCGVDPVVCHGDVHPGNVIQSAGGPVLLDWDLLCLAPPGWDHGPLLTWSTVWGGEPGLYEAFAHGYGRSFAEDPFARTVAELRLVAATLMRVRAGRVDGAAAIEAARRLRFWRDGVLTEPWCAQ